MHSEQKEARRKREKRGLRIKKSVQRSSRVRLSVFKSAKHIYGQVIDDKTGLTIVGLGSYDKELRNIKDKKEVAKEVGIRLAKLAQAKQVNEVIFDRSYFKYHGRVAAFADGAREGGLQF